MYAFMRIYVNVCESVSAVLFSSPSSIAVFEGGGVGGGGGCGDDDHLCSCSIDSLESELILVASNYA